MQILFTEPRFHTNQSGWVKALKEAGHTVHFLTLYSVASEDHTLLTPEVVPYAKSFLWTASLRSLDIESNFRSIREHAYPPLLWYWKKLRKINPDLIITRDLNAFSHLTLLYARLLNIPILLYDQTPIHRPEIKLLKRFLIKLYEIIWSGEIVRITPIVGDSVNYSASPNTHYLPFVIEPISHDSENKTFLPKHEIRILTVAKFQPRKNLMLLLTTFAKLRQAGHNVNLTLVGTANNAAQKLHLKEVRNFISEHQLQSEVNIYENVPFTQMNEVYSSHDLFVLPSEREQFGVSVLEAMSHGLPVICSNDSGVSYDVENAQNIGVFDPNESEGLYNSLVWFINNIDKYPSISKSVLNYVTKHNNKEQFMKRLETIIK